MEAIDKENPSSEFASVSVIIPCYQCSDTIERTVDSVINQILKPAELILIDDCSKDNTLDILKNLQNKYGVDWIKVVSLESNSGPSVARNRGWEIATQKYIAFLDADDAWHPEKVAIQYSWMIEHPDISLCGHSYRLIDSTNTYREFEPQPNLKTYLFSKDTILFSNPFITPSVMVKRYLNYRFNPNQRYCEDYFLWMQICLDGHQVAMLNVDLACVFKSFGNSGLTKNLLKMKLGDIKNYWELWQSKKIRFRKAMFLIAYSVIKLMPMLILGSEHYSELKRRRIMNQFHKQRQEYLEQK